MHLPRKIFDEQGRKCWLLKPDAKKDDLSTVSEAMRGYIEKKALELTDYTLEMDYDSWNYGMFIQTQTEGNMKVLTKYS
jgi:hypothetical protein